MNKRILFSIISSVLVIILIGFYFFLRIPPKSGMIRIGYLNIVASLPLFVAEEKGFLKDTGVEYETIPMGSSNQLVDGILAGNIDLFIEASAVPVLAAELQSPGKQKIFSISEITKQFPFDALLVKEDSAIKTLSDLAGKKIGVFPGSTAANLLKKYLLDNGIDVSNIKFIRMPSQNQLAALLGGSVDAIHSYEPTTSIALSKGGVRKLYGSVFAEMLSPNPQGVAVIGSNYLRKNSLSAGKVIGALERAMLFMKENDLETRQILIKYLNIPEDAAKRSTLLYMLPHQKIDVAVLQRYADMLQELGEIEGPLKVDSLIYQEKEN